MKPLDVLWVGLVVGQRYRGNSPLGTFLLNVSGTFLIGYLSVLFGVDWHTLRSLSD